MNLPAQAGYAVDVSVYQDPSVLVALKGRVDVVMIRASHGASVDTRFLAHVKAARAIGAAVGAYHFFQIEVPVSAQHATFASQLEAAGMGAGDVCPALDVERNGPGAQVSSAWSSAAAALSDRFASSFGNAMTYISPSVWALLGKPAWVLQRPIWLAEYTASPTPDSPGGKAPVMWQHRVGAFDPSGPGGYSNVGHPILDQSRVYGPLPRIGTTVLPPPPRMPSGTAPPADEGPEEFPLKP